MTACNVEYSLCGLREDLVAVRAATRLRVVGCGLIPTAPAPHAANGSNHLVRATAKSGAEQGSAGLPRRASRSGPRLH